MQCPHCGAANDDRASICTTCKQATARSGQAPAGDDAAMRMLLPVGRTALSIVAGYCGLLAIFFAPLGPIALVLGIVAVRQIRHTPGSHGMGRAIFAIVVGSLITIALALFVGAIAFAPRR